MFSFSYFLARWAMYALSGRSVSCRSDVQHVLWSDVTSSALIEEVPINGGFIKMGEVCLIKNCITLLLVFFISGWDSILKTRFSRTTPIPLICTKMLKTCTNKGCQLFSHGHDLVSTLVLCNMRLPLRTRWRARRNAQRKSAFASQRNKNRFSRHLVCTLTSHWQKWHLWIYL